MFNNPDFLFGLSIGMSIVNIVYTTVFLLVSMRDKRPFINVSDMKRPLKNLV